jgi:predicted O-methyltransferase YrrM
MKSIFERYPYLNNLRSLVSDEVITTELSAIADEFDMDVERSKISISTVNLNKIFPEELERGGIVLENFLGHWGNVSIEELCKIALIVKFLKPAKVLEIGTYNGMTALQMALNAPPECKVYTLDLPDEMMASIQLSKIDYLVSKHFKQNFGTKTGMYFQNRNDVNIIQKLGDSSTFDFKDLGNEKIDLIFIDAAHDYENKKIDSENAFKWVAKGGVILWHNYHEITCPGVTKYLADISSDYKIYHLRNTSLAVYYNK